MGSLLTGVIAQLVERLICIQEAWGSTPHNSIFLHLFISTNDEVTTSISKHLLLLFLLVFVLLGLWLGLDLGILTVVP